MPVECKVDKGGRFHGDEEQKNRDLHRIIRVKSMCANRREFRSGLQAVGVS